MGIVEEELWGWGSLIGFCMVIEALGLTWGGFFFCKPCQPFVIFKSLFALKKACRGDCPRGFVSIGIFDRRNITGLKLGQ